jgi:hypothetical protein
MKLRVLIAIMLLWGFRNKKVCGLDTKRARLFDDKMGQLYKGHRI